MTDTDNFADSRAEALLDAQVAWIMARLEGEALEAQLSHLLDSLLATAARLTLNEAVTATAIKETAVNYASRMQVGGAIPTLVGDIASALYAHPIHDETRLDELLPDRQFEELLDKLLEMKTLRETLVHGAVANPIVANLITHLLYTALQNHATRSTRAAGRVPGARSAMRLGKSFMDRATPDLGASLENSIKGYINENTQTHVADSEHYLLETLESEEFRQVVLQFWEDHKHLSVATVRDYAGELDIEELFVIGYEYWQHLRDTSIYRTLIERGVEVFFETYGQLSLKELLDDIGVTRKMMLADAMRFAPGVIDTLKSKGMLEPAIRRELEDFYRSDAVAEILG